MIPSTKVICQDFNYKTGRWAMVIKRQDKSKIVQIWGDILDEGFTSVPNILLRYRSKLGIKPHHLALIIDIMSFKWDSENPFPSYSTLAQRANMTDRGIRKTIHELERLNLLIRTQRFDEESGAQITTIFDFRPLIQRLKEEMYKAEMKHEPGIIVNTITSKGEGDLKFRGGRNYSSGGGRNYSSSKEYSYNNKTQNKNTHPKKTVPHGNAGAHGNPNIPLEARDEKERVRTHFRDGIFRKRLFEIYDNLYNIKSIEELVKEGAYKACKEIMINRANELFKIKINPDEVAEEVKSEFPYHKIPISYEKARKFFVATICNLTAEKIFSILQAGSS
jgi:hypothetical protein